MRRSTFNSAESLELLLDAICNTFGAVIFISMLVAVLVNRSAQSSSATPQDTAADIAEATLEIQQAQDRVRILSQQLEQQKNVSEHFATEESLALAGVINQQTQGRATLMKQKSEAVETTAETLGQTAILQQELMAQRKALESAIEQNHRLNEELRNQSKVNARTARIPRLRKTQKLSRVYAIDDGQLFEVTNARSEVNESECEKTTENGKVVIRPKTGAGLTILNQTATGTISGRFSQLNASNHFVQLFVSRDSFAQFQPVKDALVELGIDYEVIITDNDEVELFLGPSNRDSFVQ